MERQAKGPLPNPGRAAGVWLGLAYLLALAVPALLLRESDPAPEGLPPAELAAGAGPDVEILARSLLARAGQAGAKIGAISANALEAELRARGFAVFRQAIALEGSGPPRRAENVVGLYPGKSEAIILLVAPLESGDLGAARAAAAVLASARGLAEGTTATLGVVFAGGSDRAFEGARVFARTFARTGSILGAVAVGPLPDAQDCAFAIGAAGQPSGYAPVWLRRTGAAIAAADGEAAASLWGVSEWGARATGRSAGPHGPLLAAGVPAITYECARSGYAPRNAPSNPGPASARALRVVGRFVKTLDRADLPPLERQGSVTVREGRVISERRFTGAAAAAFMPLWVGAAIALARMSGSRGALRQAAGRFIIRILPLVAGLLALYALAQSGAWPRQAPAPDPAVAAAPAIALLWVVAAMLLVWLALRPARRFLDDLAARSGALRTGAVELAALAVVAIFTLTVNPFAAVILLLPAAWMWPLANRGPAGASLALLGGTGAVMLAVGAADATGLSWRVAPYFLETLAAGGWSVIAALAGILAVGAGLGTLNRSLA